MIDDGYPIVEVWEYKNGAKSGSLTVLEIDETKPGTGLKRYVHWKCDCGASSKDKGRKTKRLDNICNGAKGIKGGTRSCGCKQKRAFKNANIVGVIQEDLSGQVLSGFKVISKTMIQDSNRSYYYKVKCPYCGNIFPLSGRHLKDGYCSKSCGCLHNTQYGLIGEGSGYMKAKSRDEQFIMDALSQLGLMYEKEKQFIDLVNPETGGFLSFDFYLENSLNEKYIIEFDGAQHFSPSGFMRDLKVQRKLDLLKNHYCWNNGIRLIRIPYNKEYGIEDLILKTTHFELTAINQEMYYGG